MSNSTDIERLLNYARENALSFIIEYSEGSDDWEISLWGPAEDEDWFVKKRSSLEAAINDVLALAEEHNV